MFVDATYEGDLMAAAGVSCTVGREDNALYGETLNGCQPRQGWHRFAEGVSPYVRAGDPKSGLLPGVEPGPIEPEGTGDRREQAYCFRMCLTDDPENRIPFAKPASYDEREYELLLRNLEALEDPVRRKAAEKVYSAGMPWINSRMPNRKTDTNNRMGVSTDFIGRNYRWAEASYEERERILKAHLDYQKGLMWTLANHPRVPARIRDEVARWGTCRDEFKDGPGDGWQGQLYVREARRMVGESVMTEKHCRHQEVAVRSIGMAAYNMDSHHVRRYVDAKGFVRNEGDVEIASAGPYPIDYGAIVPKRGECANLLVPVCVSASHIAFGSIRMEPVFFALGQSAGAAAALAIDQGSSVQDLDYTRLRERLLKDGQVLSAFCQSESVGGTVMPYAIWACGGDPTALAGRLREIRSRSGIANFVLYGPGHGVRVSGVLDEAGYAEIGRKIRKVADLVAGDGIRVGYLMMPTMNCGIGHPWRKYLLKDGKERAFTPCPADEGFRATFAAKCAAVAREAKPFLFMMEDDFRYFGDGCHCPEHQRRLAAGEERHAMYMKDLKAIAASASAAIAAVSPGTRVGLCAPFNLRLEDSDALARILAGPKHRPYVRYFGAIYGNDTPIDLAWKLESAQEARETLPPDVEYAYESDPVPHTRFFASAARVGALLSWTAALGYDRAYHWGLGGGDDALETSPDYLDLHRRESARWEAVRTEAKRGRSCGVNASGGAYAVLNRFGVPVTKRPSSVRFAAGEDLGIDWSAREVTNLLSGAVLLDGAAAEWLTQRGYADLLGVRATKRDRVDFSGECTADGQTRFACSFHANYGLDGCAVSRLEVTGAETRTHFFYGDPSQVVQPSLTMFKNRLGGRVAVMAVNVLWARTPNVYSFAKRELLVRTLRELGGESAIPVRVVDRANVAVVANKDEDGSRLFLHLVNLSCDPFATVVFEVLPPSAGGKVEILDGAVWRPAKAVWREGRLTVEADVGVYGTLALKIGR